MGEYTHLSALIVPLIIHSPRWSHDKILCVTANKNQSVLKVGQCLQA